MASTTSRRWSRPVQRAALVLLTAAAACPGCLAERAPTEVVARHETVTAATDDSRHPAVLALRVRGIVGCTGTVIAERVVLTAAHCLDPAAPDDVVLGTPGAADARTIAVIDGRPHPDYDPTTLAHDVGVLLLAAPAGVTPMSLATAAPTAGRSVDLVGYGRTSASDGSPPRRRTGTATIASVEATTFHVGPAPSLPCEGDSGGPIFDESSGATPVLLGVVSSGSPDCATTATASRVDGDVAAFVSRYVEATAVGAARAGARCWYAENCGAGDCVRPSDSPLGYCSTSCGASAPCPAAMECTAGRCRHPMPSPGAMGAGCRANDDCASFFCARATCTRLCFANDPPGDCPPSWECARVAADASISACFVAEAKPVADGSRGSCALGSPARAGAGAGHVAAACALIAGWLARQRSKPGRRPARRNARAPSTMRGQTSSSSP